jgi:hypothetical protein
MDKVQLRLRAIQLRESGFSYTEILKEIKVPKSTLAYWVKGIPLDDQQESLLKSRMIERQKRGRFSTSIALRARKVYRDKMAYDDAEKEFNTWKGETAFMAGISLYWAHGGKKSGYFQFISNDNEMLVFMVKWIRKYLGISKKDLIFRLFIHEPNKAQNIEDFWSKSLSVPKDRLKITKVGGRGMHKNPQYKGSCMVAVTPISVLRKVLAWQNQLIKYYKDTELHP